MGMEEETRNFLVLIMQTASSIILWLLMNIFFGIYLKYGLFEKTPSITNIVYYIIFLTGCFFLFKYFRKRWQEIEVN
jgi:uncharacterized membrane protein (DUF373 family)